jgi:hypothetical protein
MLAMIGAKGMDKKKKNPTMTAVSPVRACTALSMDA